MIAELLAALLITTTPGPHADSQALTVPAGTPPTVIIDVVRDGRQLQLDLRRHAIRKPGVPVQAWQADGTYVAVPAPPPATYRGTVVGELETAVVASLMPRGMTATVFPADGVPWTIRPSAADPELHVIGAPVEAQPIACGAIAPAMFRMAPPPEPIATAADGPACQYLCEIAFDADFEYFALKGGSVANVVAAIDAHMNEVDFFYARDLNVTYTITHYIVRTSPFYTPTSGGDLLDQFRAEWNSNQAGVTRDIAHLMTDKPGSIIEYGGLAWVGAVCTDIGYGWSRDSAGIIGHEIGHNWNAPHCLDPDPCNAMCGACLNIGPVTRQVMIAHRDSRACLDALGPYPESLPPFVSPEHASLRRHAFEATGPRAFDVLANDGDGNCDPLSIDAHDATSQRGGTVTLSTGTGSAGRDELVYELPAIPYLGADSFTYDVGDGTGEATTGTVTVSIRSSVLAGYWPLDDGPGAIHDATGAGRDGTAIGAPFAVPGAVGNGLTFDGVADSVTIPPLDLDTDEATITAWVRRTGNQPTFAGLVFCRGGTTTSGLSFGSINELRYHWNDAQPTYVWNSGLIVPDDTWTFVALVVESDRATIYMHDGTTMQSSVRVTTHAVEAFDAETYLGWDPSSATRRFAGTLDDVRIYDHALDAAAVAALESGVGRAEAPAPPDGGRLIEPGRDLTWLAGPGADAHDVYLGTDYAAVRDATTASAEYTGRVTAARYPAGLLLPDTLYYWRVDTVADLDIVPGLVWQFTPARVRYWPLDESTGSTVDDLYGDDDGTLIGGAALGQPAATPALGTAVYLDGVNDRIEVPVLGLHSANVTMSAWIRRQGAQVDAAGIVFNRAASTIAGLNLGPAEDLRYHWDGSYWSWESGLDVPDATWTFVALVIDPLRATLYTGIDGVLASAVNEASHAPEEFDGVTQIGQGIPGGRYFRGDMDDVRIYDASLTAQQVEALYDAGLGEPCPDLNGSGVVDFADVLATIGAWGPCAGCPEDFDGSGDVGFADLLFVIGRWAMTCP